MGKVRHKPNSKSRANKKVQGVLIIITYQSLLNAFGQMIRKYFYLMQLNEEKKLLSQLSRFKFEEPEN